VSPARPSQVSLRTAFTVCFAVVASAALVLFLYETRLALTITVAAVMLAVALHHVVRLLQSRGLGPAAAIAVTVLGVILIFVGLSFLVIPTAVQQLRDFIAAAPKMVDNLRHAAWFLRLNAWLDLDARIKDAVPGALDVAQGALNPILGVLTSALGLVAAFVTILTLTVFMLVFGGSLLARLLGLTSTENRAVWERVLAQSYRAVGGYLGGVLFICSVNATLTTTYLAISRVPYFLPLGILSGLSSLVPYAGPVLVGGLITVLALVSGGLVKGLITLGYFLLYGQLEGNVLGPLVFKRTVHLDPLITLLSVLFLAELLGIVGAVLAVPAVALAQIMVRELLQLRRERLARDESGGPPAHA
jgi:putative heme transporter